MDTTKALKRLAARVIASTGMKATVVAPETTTNIDKKAKIPTLVNNSSTRRYSTTGAIKITIDTWKTNLRRKLIRTHPLI